MMKKIMLKIMFVFAFLMSAGINIVHAQGTPQNIWSVQTGAVGIRSVSVSLDGSVVVTSADHLVEVRSEQNGSLITSYPVTNNVVSASVSPEGTYFAAGYYYGTFPSLGRSDIVELSTSNTFYVDGAFSSFSNNGSLVASTGGGVTRHIYEHNILTQSLIFDVYYGAAYPLAVQYTPSSDMLAVSSSESDVKLFSTTNGSLIRSFTGQNNDVYCISISPDGTILAAGEGGFDASGESKIYIWNIETGQLITTLPGHGYWVDAVSFTSDGNYLLSSGRDGAPPDNNPKIKIWRTSDWSLQTYYDEGLAYSTIVAVVPGQNLFAYGNSYGQLYLAELPPVTPVEFSAFTALANKNNILLNWSTATETNNKGFDIERQLNSIRSTTSNSGWETIGYVGGSGTTTLPHQYSFNDNNLAAGIYNYRLKQIDFDGSFQYSNIVTSEVKKTILSELEQNYPNPFNPQTKIEYQLAKSGFVNISVYNLLSEKIKTLVNEYQEVGIHQTEFNGKGLPGGVYIYEIRSNDFTLAKKMILLK